MKIEKIRKGINVLDKRMLELLNQRTKLSLEIGRIKNEKKASVYAPERESEVYGNLEKINKGPLPNKSLKAIYREIMSSSLGLQKKLVIAYLGPEATFTHTAARMKFGTIVEYLPADSISEVFSSVEKENADYGVVPIENSTEGAVTHTLDVFMDSNLKVCAEIMLGISHNLIAKGRGLNTIKKVYSNPQVFGQCRTWLNANLPKADLIEVSSTAKAALLASKERGAAAIAGRLAADLYGLKIIFKDIEDVQGNMTRFLVVGPARPARAGKTGNDKTSVMFAVKDRVGALYDTLKVFKQSGINLTKIESRPSKRKAWEYYFFVDFNGHCEDARVKTALERLEKHCSFVKILGSYPRMLLL